MPRGATFVGPTAQQMVSHPSPRASGTRHKGPIIGVEIDGNTPFRFDPWWLMDNGHVNAMTFMIVAALRQGKSAVIKLIIKRLMKLAPGGRSLSGVINDYRPEGDGTEYSKLADYLGCTVFRMKDMRFNVLDPRLYLDDKGKVSHFALIEMVRRVAEFEQKTLDELEMLALRLVMRELVEMHEALWGFSYIGRMSGGITGDCYSNFMKLDNGVFTEEIERSLSKVSDPTVKQTIIEQHNRVVKRPDNITLADLQAAGVRLRNRLEAIYDGVAGGVFGQDYSYYDLATQPLSVRDWRGLSPAAERLLKLVIGRIDIAAIDNNRAELKPDFMVDDELHRAMRNPQFVEDRLYRQQITRSLGIFEIGGTHSLDSVRVGEPGSKLYRASQTIINNTGAIFFGRLPKEEKLLAEAKAFGGLTDYEVWRLTTAPKHCFGIKFNPADNMIMFRATPFGGDLHLIDTDSATRNKAQSGFLDDDAARERFALANGARYIGGQ